MQNKIYRRETDFKVDAIRFLKERYGRDVWFYKANDNFTKGIPDLILCFFGRFVAIELKRDEKSAVAPLQLINIRRIQDADGFAFIAKTLDELKCSMERIREIIGK